MAKTVFRKCLVSKIIADRHELIRIVKTKDGQVLIDSTCTIQGRGAYLSKDKNVILKAQKGNMLKRALRIDIPNEIYVELLKKV